ncbi:MAG: hypothetical protein ACOYI8_09410 [Christensenellales bacterium]
MKKAERFAVQDDTGYYCFYKNDLFEVIWRATDGTPKPMEGSISRQTAGADGRKQTGDRCLHNAKNSLRGGRILPNAGCCTV